MQWRIWAKSVERFKKAVGVFALLVFLPSSVFSLEASGTWSSKEGELAGEWVLTYTVDSELMEVSGSIALTNMPGTTGGAVHGSMGASSISFGILYEAQEVAVFEGVIADQGTRFTGTFVKPDGFSGEWKGEAQVGQGTTPP